LAERGVMAARRSMAEVACTASTGDAFVMRPLIVHSSSKVTGSSRRQVLHIVIGPRVPGYERRWQHAVQVVR